jgi:uncharacterized protein (TIGR02118 family)
MYRMTILYGTPTDPEAFRTYYLQTHVPLARQMKGLTGWNLQWIDGHPDWILVAELYAEDEAAMDAVLASPEGVAASKDLDNFVTGGVMFLTGEEEQVALS